MITLDTEDSQNTWRGRRLAVTHIANSKVDPSIRRYRARFCKRNLTAYRAERAADANTLTLWK
jgi:hypothetical protein